MRSDAAEAQKPEYIKFSASHPQYPPWILVVPDDMDGMKFMVGLSNYHVSEVEARTDAVRDAINQFARFTGVEVREFDRMFMEIYGQNVSEVLDPAITAIRQSEHLTEAEVSRIKASEWYSESYRVTQGRANLGIAYKYWVLVTVPQDEVERVREWRRKQQDFNQQVMLRVQQEAHQELEEILRTNAASVNTIRNALQNAELGQAVRGLWVEWNRLYDAKTRFETGSVHHQARVPRINELQSDLTNELIRSIQAAIVIDTGRNPVIRLSSGDDVTDVPVWIWMRTNEGYLPVSGIPLLLVDAQGKRAATARSTSDGKAVFRPTSHRFDAGRYYVLMDAAQPPISAPDPIARDLMEVRGELAILPTGAGPAEIIMAAINRLFLGPSFGPQPLNTVVIQPITYGDTGLATELSPVLARWVNESLLNLGHIKVISAKESTQAPVDRVIRTRGITMDGTLVSINSPGVQASMVGAEGALTTHYHENGKHIVVNMELRKAGSNILLATTSVNLDRALLPSGLQVRPPPDPFGRLTSQVHPSAIEIEVCSESEYPQVANRAKCITDMFFRLLDSHRIEEAYKFMDPSFQRNADFSVFRGMAMSYQIERGELPSIRNCIPWKQRSGPDIWFVRCIVKASGNEWEESTWLRMDEDGRYHIVNYSQAITRIFQ